jgi:hypothetical protein
MSTLLAWTLLLALDGGVIPPPLTPEDREVVDNLELLQDLESAADLELMQEL